jgi:hypothetical protein
LGVFFLLERLEVFLLEALVDFFVEAVVFVFAFVFEEDEVFALLAVESFF